MGVEHLTTVPIPGTQRPVWPGSQRVADLASSADILATAWMKPKRGGELDVAYAQKLGATPPLQRAYIDRETLIEQTSADPADVETFRRYCESCGIKVEESQWRSVVISGSVERMAHAFGTDVGIFEDEGKRRFRDRSGSLHAPADVAGVVRGVFGLDQWPRSRKLGALQRHLTPLSASDVVKRYAFPEGTGKGQTIGVLQFRGEFKPNDFDRCMSAQGVVAAQPSVKRVDNAAVAHEIETTKDLEAALDVQIIGALAPGARIVVHESPDDERGFIDAIRAAVFDKEYQPSILSISYGWPEQLWTPSALNVLNELFIAAALVGVSVFCSSGDNGAELDNDGKPHVVAPASCPFSLACGATVIGANGDDQERAWDKTGGGYSAHFDAVPWQRLARYGVPDVAIQEQPGYLVYMDGFELAMGGTSAAAPAWAALTARINEHLGVPIGFFAPILYDRARAGLFREITAGSNGTFQACAGWNPCTGLGVPIGTEIEKALRDGR
jgi:kumamolisin